MEAIAKYSWLALIIFSLILGFAGFYSRNRILKANSCKMTYSSKERSYIDLCGPGCEYSLWKISNPSSAILNKQPVLFVPGHLGSASQARSLASAMHNGANYFQYFAMDFNGGYAALHGSDIFTQAYAINKALASIVRLYQNQNEYIGPLDSDLKIIIVGHSIGGMVARAAVLLSETKYQQFVVRDIIQLSTPNTSPPYSADASLERVYRAINLAWKIATATTEVTQYNLGNIATATTTTNSSSSSHSTEASVSGVAGGITFPCLKCAAFVRITSISGGEVDIQVDPALTYLHQHIPRSLILNKIPNNNNLMANKTRHIDSSSAYYSYFSSSMNRFVDDIITLCNPIMLHYIYPLQSQHIVNNNNISDNSSIINSSDSSSNSISVTTTISILSGNDNNLNAFNCTSNPDDMSDDVAGSEYCIQPALQQNNNSNGNYTECRSAVIDGRAAADIVIQHQQCKKTESHLIEKTNESEEPVAVAFESAADNAVASAPLLLFFSARSSQLKKVGFPVDHDSMVWCFDLLQVITRGMNILSTTSLQTPLHWETAVFPITAYKSHSRNDSDDVVELQTDHQRRWLQSTIDERAYIFNQQLRQHGSSSSSSYWQRCWVYCIEYIPYDFITKHAAVKITVCYILLCCLMLVAMILTKLTGNNNGGVDDCCSNNNNISSSSHKGSSSSYFDRLLCQPLLSLLGYHDSYSICNTMETILFAVYFQAVKPLFPVSLHHLIFAITWRLFGVLGAIKLGYDVIFFHPSSSSSSHTTTTVVEYYLHTTIYWLIAWMLAMLLRGCLLRILLTPLRTLCSLLYSIIRYVLRNTLWRRPVRRTVRLFMKNITTRCKKIAPRLSSYFLSSSFVSVLLLLVVLGLCYLTSYQQATTIQLSTITYVLCLLAMTSFAAMVTGWMAMIVHPNCASNTSNTIGGNQQEEHVAYRTELVLLYLPALLLALPTMWYCYRLLYYTSNSSGSGDDGILSSKRNPFLHHSVQSMFDADLAAYITAVSCIAAHLWSSRYTSCTLDTMEPIRWLFDVAGPHVIAQYHQTFGHHPSYSSSSSRQQQGSNVVTSSSSSSGCCRGHEDGGRNAVFERINHINTITTGASFTNTQGGSLDVSTAKTVDDDNIVEVAHDVLLGCTYKVVCCDCVKVYGTKDYTQLWCSWCLCRICNGKNLPPDSNWSSSRSYTNNSYSSRDENSEHLSDASADLFPILVLVGILCYHILYVEVTMTMIKPYQYMYYSGLIGMAFLFRQLLGSRSIS